MRRRSDILVYVLTAIFLLGAGSIWWQGIRPSPRLESQSAAGAEHSGLEQTFEDGPSFNSASEEPESPVQIWVHVAGAVEKPGVYKVEEGQRVHHALEMAVPLANADLDALNLAAVLRDSDKIYVPKKGEAGAVAKSGSVVSGSQGSGNAQQAIGPRFPVNINTASAVELDWLPGIGPSLANAIITYRTENGSFAKPEDIQKVSGIGEKTYAKLADLIVVR